MQIKRFVARSMSEALQKVKAELGPEAIILSARTVKHNELLELEGIGAENNSSSSSTFYSGINLSQFAMRG